MTTTIISAPYTLASSTFNLNGNDSSFVLIEGATYALNTNFTNTTAILSQSGTIGQRIQIDGNLLVAGDSFGHGVMTSGATHVFVGQQGQITATSPSYSAVYLGLQAKDGVTAANVLTNAGEITNVGGGVFLANGGNTITNTGMIAGGLSGVVVWDTSGNDKIMNSGTITGSVYDGINSEASGTTIDNSGLISGGRHGIGASGTVNVTNAGDIRSISDAAIGAAGLNLTNSGIIESTTSTGISLGSAASTISNSGTIRGVTAISSNANQSLTLTNSGLIDGRTDAIMLFGNADDTITNRGRIDGNVSLGGGDDIFDTRDGAVEGTVRGDNGNDIYVVSSTDIVLVESTVSGTDTVRTTVSWTLGANFENLVLLGNADLRATGNGLANQITGNAGDNRLDGAGGTDTLIGGDGDDLYITDGLDLIIEGADAGTDTVRSSGNITIGDYIENIILTGSALNATGNGEDNMITGNRQDNVLIGNGGSDILIGGRGNDAYVIDGEDVVIEQAGEGIDIVYSSLSVTLGANLENLSLTGSAGISGVGNAVANTLTGNMGNNTLSGLEGNDVLDGNGGADRLIGGTGNDTYITDGGDAIIEAAGEGTDTVRSSVTHALSANVENLTLTGVAAANATGNTLANIILGNAAANTIDGGAGNDQLGGGAGRDVFVFTAALIPANADRILDFNVADDTIRLDDRVFNGLAVGALSGAAFVRNTSGNAADASDRIIYESDTGKLFFDRDGTGAAAKVHFATLEAGLSVTRADFLVF